MRNLRIYSPNNFPKYPTAVYNILYLAMLFTFLNNFYNFIALLSFQGP